jgi:hypothetical protein
MAKNKKIKESKQDRLERIEILGGFGKKRTQVIKNKKKYSRKEKGTKATVPFDFNKLLMRYINEQTI